MNDAASLPLRDIHLPDSVSWWPPGPGWWLLLLLLTIGIAVSIFLWRRYQQRALSRAVLSELNKIEYRYQQQLDLRQLAVDLSTLLRRTSISLLGRQKIAALTGEQWLSWLDQQTGTDQFSKGPGQHLISAPYQAKPEFYPDALIALCRHWLQRVPAHYRKYPAHD
ncbi:MAG: DUF4381 domain-containing protein [Gammaproteobacteria bacterium]|nr:DUF4381 domain-containing protein [Gammaproteobacteria bacterium]